MRDRTGERRWPHTLAELREDARGAPDIDGRTVPLVSQQHLRWAIPEGDDLQTYTDCHWEMAVKRDTSSVSWRMGVENVRPNPKSASFAIGFSASVVSIKMLCGLRSRCIRRIE